MFFLAQQSTCLIFLGTKTEVLPIRKWNELGRRSESLEVPSLTLAPAVQERPVNGIYMALDFAHFFGSKNLDFMFEHFGVNVMIYNHKNHFLDYRLWQMYIFGFKFPVFVFSTRVHARRGMPTWRVTRILQLRLRPMFSGVGFVSWNQWCFPRDGWIEHLIWRWSFQSHFGFCGVPNFVSTFIFLSLAQQNYRISQRRPWVVARPSSTWPTPWWAAVLWILENGGENKNKKQPVHFGPDLKRWTSEEKISRFFVWRRNWHTFWIFQRSQWVHLFPPWKNWTCHCLALCFRCRHKTCHCFAKASWRCPTRSAWPATGLCPCCCWWCCWPPLRPALLARWAAAEFGLMIHQNFDLIVSQNELKPTPPKSTFCFFSSAMLLKGFFIVCFTRWRPVLKRARYNW